RLLVTDVPQPGDLRIELRTAIRPLTAAQLTHRSATLRSCLGPRHEDSAARSRRSAKVRFVHESAWYVISCPVVGKPWYRARFGLVPLSRRPLLRCFACGREWLAQVDRDPSETASSKCGMEGPR